MISKEQLAEEYVQIEAYVVPGILDTEEVRKAFLAGYDARDSEVVNLSEALEQICNKYNEIIAAYRAWKEEK